MNRIMKIQIFWSHRLCYWLICSLSFEGSFYIHLQAQAVQVLLGLLDPVDEGSTILRNFQCYEILPSRWRQYIPPKRRHPPNALHGIISPNTAMDVRLLYDVCMIADRLFCCFWSKMFFKVPPHAKLCPPIYRVFSNLIRTRI